MTDTSTVTPDETAASELPDDSPFKAPPKPAVPVIAHGAWGAGAKRVPLFTISQPHPLAGQTDDNGHPYPQTIETTYDMPAARHPGMLLEYLTIAREQGEVFAMGWVLKKVIGPDGFRALVSEPDVGEGVIGGIVERVQDVLGGKAKDVDYSVTAGTHFPS